MRTTRKVLYVPPRDGGEEGTRSLFAAQAALLEGSGVEAVLAEDPEAAGATIRDLVVAPPSALGRLGQWPGEKWIYAGGRLELFAGRVDANAWEEGGVRGVMCPSRPMADLVEGIFPNLKTQVVHPWIDPMAFPSGRKRPRIAWSGGSPEEWNYLRNVFAARSRRYREVEWASTMDTDAEARSKALAESAVYLFMGSEAGLDTGPLEAWAAACLVVGVKSLGVSEYARPGNGIWVEPGDVLELADDLELAVTLAKNNHQSVRTMVDQGRDAAATYRVERTATELADLVLLKPL